MLKELNILNGELSLEFDPLNTKYTVKVKENILSLDIDYKISNDCQIAIIGNNLVDNYTEVIVTVYNDKEILNYYLFVYKDLSNQVSNNLDELISLDTPVNQEVSSYAVPVISSICFLTILIVFTILFHKKKKV